ncbi:ribosomal RNA small subunit methyltransferase, mitochondrial [Tanacetum coccineum]
MLHFTKPSLNHLRLYFHQIRAKTSRPYYKTHLDKDDIVDGYIRKKKENQEDRLHLYKSKGQHLLTNPRIIDSIVRNSGVGPEDTVLEIGPGTGNLTMKLLEVAKKVYAVEVDKRMVEIISKDALKADFPEFDLVVANIPYCISSPLVAKFVFGGYKFRSATLLVQKEFATRLLANPGDSEFNRLAVNARRKKVAELLNLSTVTSSDEEDVVEADDGDVSDDEDDGENVIGAGGNLFKEKLVGILRDAGLEDKRPSKLSNEELMYLLALFNKAGIFFHDKEKPRDINASFADL